MICKKSSLYALLLASATFFSAPMYGMDRYKIENFNYLGNGALHELSNEKEIKNLLDNGFSLLERNYFGDTPLRHAIRYNDNKKLVALWEVILKNKLVDVLKKDVTSDGKTLLHFAAQVNHEGAFYAIYYFMLDDKDFIFAKDENENTAFDYLKESQEIDQKALNRGDAPSWRLAILNHLVNRI